MYDLLKPPFVLSSDRVQLVAAESNGSLIIDKLTGGIYELNAAATVLWTTALAGFGSGTKGAPRLRSEARLSQDSLDTMIGYLPFSSSPVVVDKSGFTGSLRGSAVDVSQGGRLIATLDIPSGDLVAQDDLSIEQRVQLGLWISPKALACRGRTVLHASSFRLRDGRAISIAGQSGAGKTTTAHVLGELGATVLAGDMTVTWSDGSKTFVVDHAECVILEKIKEWAHGKNERLPGRSLEAFSTSISQLTEVWYLSRHNRTASGELVFTELSQTKALMQLLKEVFLAESPDNTQLLAVATLVRSSAQKEILAPEGIDSLKSQLSLWISMMTSNGLCD